MLVIPKDSNNLINIIGIDPGTTFMGIAIISVNLDTLEIASSDAFTLNGVKLSDSESWPALMYGDRFNRIKALEEKLLRIFLEFKPHAIAAEAPFFGIRHPNAFQALIEVVNGIRNATINYDIWKQLLMIPPSLVKNAVGLKGHVDKHAMKERVSNFPFLKYSGVIPIQQLDEHSIDALAIAYYLYKSLINGGV